MFSCQASFPPRNLFSKASRTAVIQEINICDSGCEGAEPCLDIDTDNCIIGELMFRLTVSWERCHTAFLWWEQYVSPSNIYICLLTLSINVSNSFWHYFQQHQETCLRKVILHMLQCVSPGHLGRDHWQVGSFKSLLFVARKPVLFTYVCEGCQNLTFCLDSLWST